MVNPVQHHPNVGLLFSSLPVAPQARQPNPTPLHQSDFFEKRGRSLGVLSRINPSRATLAPPMELEFASWLGGLGHFAKEVKFIDGANRTFIVKWPDGNPLDGENTSIFRLNNEAPTDLVNLLERLHAAGIPVSKAREISGKHHHAINSGPLKGVVTRFEFAPGDVRGDTTKEMNAIEAGRYGAALGELHTQTTSWSQSPLSATPADLRSFMATAEGLKNWYHIFDGPTLDRANKLCGQVCEKIASLKLESIPGSYGYCHLDPHSHNVLFSEEGVTLIDWDTFAPGFRLYDIAVALKCEDSGLGNQPQRDALLQGYEKARGKTFSHEERIALPLFKAQRELRILQARMEVNSGWLNESLPVKGKSTRPMNHQDREFISDRRQQLQDFCVEAEAALRKQ